MNGCPLLVVYQRQRDERFVITHCLSTTNDERLAINRCLSTMTRWKAGDYPLFIDDGEMNGWRLPVVYRRWWDEQLTITRCLSTINDEQLAITRWLLTKMMNGGLPVVIDDQQLVNVAIDDERLAITPCLPTMSKWPVGDYPLIIDMHDERLTITLCLSTMNGWRLPVDYRRWWDEQLTITRCLSRMMRWTTVSFSFFNPFNRKN